tara:strand:+ start:1512 stop:1946 length:435 start_codon:yes stop_codon:yes gene_type:complete
VFDHVDAGRVLEQPAREYPAEIVLRAAFEHQHLDEGTDLLRQFPRRGALAGLKPHDHIADAARFAGRHFQVLRQIVALVEQPYRSHPLGQRGTELRFVGGIGRRRGGIAQTFGNSGGDRIGLGRFLGAARQQQGRPEQHRKQRG